MEAPMGPLGPIVAPTLRRHSPPVWPVGPLSRRWGAEGHSMSASHRPLKDPRVSYISQLTTEDSAGSAVRGQLPCRRECLWVVQSLPVRGLAAAAVSLRERVTAAVPLMSQQVTTTRAPLMPA